MLTFLTVAKAELGIIITGQLFILLREREKLLLCMEAAMLLLLLQPTNRGDWGEMCRKIPNTFSVIFPKFGPFRNSKFRRTETFLIYSQLLQFAGCFGFFLVLRELKFKALPQKTQQNLKENENANILIFRKLAFLRCACCLRFDVDPFLGKKKCENQQFFTIYKDSTHLVQGRKM